MLLLPGAVNDPRGCPTFEFGTLDGVDGPKPVVNPKVPSLVPGRLLLFPIADPGLAGGGIGLSGEKKLDLLRPFCLGDAGICAKLSIVRSDRDGRDFLDAGRSTSPSSAWKVVAGSGSLKPCLEEALEEHREDDRNPSSEPSPSFSCVPLFVVGRVALFSRFCRDGGLPTGFLNTPSSVVGFFAAGAGVDLFVFNCDEGREFDWVFSVDREGRASTVADGFFLRVSEDCAGLSCGLSCELLAGDRNTGSLEDRGRPEGRGRPDGRVEADEEKGDGSIVTVAWRCNRQGDENIKSHRGGARPWGGAGELVLDEGHRLEGGKRVA
jgi:hypothetical protein